MHKSTIALATIVLLAGQAYGAPDPREIDTRVLADGTDNGDYGAGGTLDDGGLDVLALDVYEATVPGTTEPALVLRLIVQGGDPSLSHRIDLTLDAGSPATFEFTSDDLASYASATFAAVRGPYDVGDGHPKAIEGIIPYAALGLQSSDTVGGITVTSSAEGADTDTMPGSWYFGGVEIPAIPGSEGEPGSYRLAGTPSWFSLTADPAFVKPSTAGSNVTLRLTNHLAMTEQVITLAATAPVGTTANASAATVLLAPGESKDVTLVSKGFGVGDIRVLATSELGLSRLISVPIASDPVVGNGAGVAGPLLKTGESYQYRFTTPARFEYHCHPHPHMLGVVTIIADDPTDAPAVHLVRIQEGDSSDPQSYGFSPAELTVQVNDTVVWVNEGAAQHNVHGTTGLAGDGHDHDHHHGEEPPAQDTPAPPLVLLGMALLVMALRRR